MMTMIQKTLVRTTGAALMIAFAAVLVPVTPAEAASCGGKYQKACPWYKKGNECGTWLREVGGICKPCGSKNQRACKVISKGPACKHGLLIKKGKCVPANQTVIGKIGEGISDAADTIGDGVGGALNALQIKKVKKAAQEYGPRIAGAARDVARALPRGETARAVVSAIKRKDAMTVQSILLADPKLAPVLQKMQRMGFRTLTVGLESSGAFGLAGAHETGVSIDLSGAKRARLYTTTSVAGGYIAGGGNDLVFSFFRAKNNKIGGHAFGSIAEFDVGSGAGLNMWFLPKPFDFAGFSVGVGVGSVGGGGAVTYGYSKIWN